MIPFLMLLALTLAQPVAPAHWCYESQSKVISCTAPSQWPGSCQGQQQSPIDIDTDKTIRNSSLKPFSFTNYDWRELWSLKNNGHSVEVKLNDKIKISGGGLKETYKAVSFHLHWSNSLDEGSEHTINGRSYAMEMHIVHIKNKYGDLSEALRGNSNDEIAVLGFLIKPSLQNHSGFMSLVEGLSRVPYQIYDTSLEKFSLFDLIPKVNLLKNYYRYWGSLTTPDCQEKVIWTLFHEPIHLHQNQIFEFSRKLYYNMEDEKPSMAIIDNFRKTQPIGNREVFTSGVGILLSQAWPVLLAPLLTYLLPVFLY
ncbi:carbonic anhydrase 4 [Petaurus breviceps papuanus]|uniref:carbonic anhydrase 4 n=1 Tax=Petaurus breviceps papuanus TaxID=3040969 RepID=UPI0036DF2719